MIFPYLYNSKTHRRPSTACELFCFTVLRTSTGIQLSRLTYRDKRLYCAICVICLFQLSNCHEAKIFFQRPYNIYGRCFGKVSRIRTSGHIYSIAETDTTVLGILNTILTHLTNARTYLNKCTHMKPSN